MQPCEELSGLVKGKREVQHDDGRSAFSVQQFASDVECPCRAEFQALVLETLLENPAYRRLRLDEKYFVTPHERKYLHALVLGPETDWRMVLRSFADHAAVWRAACRASTSRTVARGCGGGVFRALAPPTTQRAVELDEVREPREP